MARTKQTSRVPVGAVRRKRELKKWNAALRSNLVHVDNAAAAAQHVLTDDSREAYRGIHFRLSTPPAVVLLQRTRRPLYECAHCEHLYECARCECTHETLTVCSIAVQTPKQGHDSQIVRELIGHTGIELHGDRALARALKMTPICQGKWHWCQHAKCFGCRKPTTSRFPVPDGNPLADGEVLCPTCAERCCK